MCVAIPTLIKSVDGQNAQVEIGGIERTISIALTPEAKVDDYVIVHTGFALSVLDEAEAQETLRMFAEIAAIEQTMDREGA
jgi:hydrogenase expression/formation protein HypC